MSDAVREIALSRGKVALVDAADYERVAQFKWYASYSRGRWCAQRFSGTRKNRVCIKMHRFIMDAPDGVMVDHRSRETLDNRRNNLRLASHAQNQRNQGSYCGSSRFKGVMKDEREGLKKQWRAAIVVDRKSVFLGRFLTEEEAAQAYDEAALRLHGEFACTNFERIADVGSVERMELPEEKTQL